MPVVGRPRLAPEELAARIADYCRQYGVRVIESGLPPFPRGRRETPQHREWMKLYKAHNRMARRTRSQCERCANPAGGGSVFCEEHRAETAGRSGGHGATSDERKILLAAQGGRCPICGRDVGLWDALDHDHASGRLRGILHAVCNQLVGAAEAIGPDALKNARRYLTAAKADEDQGSR